MLFRVTRHVRRCFAFAINIAKTDSPSQTMRVKYQLLFKSITFEEEMLQKLIRKHNNTQWRSILYALL